MSIITSFFPSIFACIRPNHRSSAPVHSQSFDFFDSLEFDEETGRINISRNDKKRKCRNTFLRSSTKGKHSLSCIGTRNKKVDKIQQTSEFKYICLIRYSNNQSKCTICIFPSAPMLIQIYSKTSKSEHLQNMNTFFRRVFTFWRFYCTSK